MTDNRQAEEKKINLRLAEAERRGGETSVEEALNEVKSEMKALYDL